MIISYWICDVSSLLVIATLTAVSSVTVLRTALSTCVRRLMQVGAGEWCQLQCYVSADCCYYAPAMGGVGIKRYRDSAVCLSQGTAALGMQLP